MKSLSDVKFTKMKSLRESDDKTTVKSSGGKGSVEVWVNVEEVHRRGRSPQNVTRKGRSLAEDAAWLGRWGGRWGVMQRRRDRSGTGVEGWGYHRTKSSSFQRVSGEGRQWRFRKKKKKIEQGKEESWGRTDEVVSIIFAECELRPSSGRRGFTGGPNRKLLEKWL